MDNCIFSGHCFEHYRCDKSCPTLAQTSYLLERNGIQMNNPVFRSDTRMIKYYTDILEEASGSIRAVVESGSTNTLADGLTYCSICNTWKGSQLHCTTYNLKFSQYLEGIQKSWSYNADSTEIDYIKMWAQGAKVLIISNIDYVNFKEFQSQTLLSLLQSRMNPDFTTIIVSPPINNLVGEGPFFARLTDTLSKQKVKVSHDRSH